MTGKDTGRMLRETKEFLVKLIQIDTSNPPGNETVACEYIKEVFAAEGIESEILESAPGRGSIIARLKGDGSKKPLLVAGHLDVVPANPDDWSVDPFSGVEKDGCIWGRGAMDMKNTIAINMAAFLELKRRNAPLKRDIIFCAAADEEQSGYFGVGWLAEKHFDKLECEYALNEGGGTAIEMEGRNVYMIQNAEKGVNWLKVVTRGEPGHGSVPKGDNALVKMAEVLNSVAKPLPPKKTKIVEEMTRELGKVLKFPKNIAFKGLSSPVFADLILGLIKTQDKSLAEMISALLRDTISPTVIKAGYKENVIPEKCEAVLDCRILPGTTSKGFEKFMQDKLKGAEVKLMDLPVPDPTESPINTELYECIKTVVKSVDPKTAITPLLMPGATDNRFMRVKGITAYGFCPMKSETHSLKELTERIHGIDERVPVDAIEFGADTMLKILEKFCT